MVKKIFKYSMEQVNSNSNVVSGVKFTGILLAILLILVLGISTAYFLGTLIPLIILMVIAFIIFMVLISKIFSKMDTEPKNMAYIVDDTGRIFKITRIIFNRYSNVTETEEFNYKINNFEEIEKILEDAKNYEVNLSNGGNFVSGVTRSNPYIVQEILKVHSYEEMNNYIKINCDYSVNYKNINYNATIEISKSINNWNELFELLKICIRDDC